MNNNHERFEYLDGLRGLAALVVVIHHMVLTFYPDYANGNIRYLNASQTLPLAPFSLVWAGNLSVCIFFALSGYVLAPMTLREDSYFITQIVRRIVRLGIPIFAALAFGYILWTHGLFFNKEAAETAGTTGWADVFFTGPPKFWNVLKDTLFMPFRPIKGKSDPVVWTMHWEYLGSFGIFLIYTLFHRRKWRLPVMAIVLYLTAADYYSDFAVGALLADLEVAKKSRRLTQPVRNLFLCLLLLGFFVFGFEWAQGPGTPYHFLDYLPTAIFDHHAEKAHQIAAMFLLAAVIMSSRAKRALSAKPVLRLGKASFAIYLLHFPVICSIGAWVFLQSCQSWGFHPATLAALIAVLASTYALSTLFTRYIDRPATKLSQRIARRFDAWLDLWWISYTKAFLAVICRIIRPVAPGRAKT